MRVLSDIYYVGRATIDHFWLKEKNLSGSKGFTP